MKPDEGNHERDESWGRIGHRRILKTTDRVERGRVDEASLVLQKTTESSSSVFFLFCSEKAGRLIYVVPFFRNLMFHNRK